MFSSEKKYFKVHITRSDGKVSVGESVTFYLNNKKLKTVKTDKKGYAKVKINKKIGTYKIKVVYNSFTVTKTIKVKRILNDIKCINGKNVNKVTLKITTNKVNGKYFKGQTVKFKLLGKTYKAKINKKGVAQVAVKKSALPKKCKLGLTYSVKATFKKESTTTLIAFIKMNPKLTYYMGWDAFANTE